MVEVTQLVTLIKNRLQFILVSHLINYKHDLQSSLIKFTSSGKENKRAGGSKLTSDPTKEPASNNGRRQDQKVEYHIPIVETVITIFVIVIVTIISCHFFKPWTGRYSKVGRKISGV